MTETKGLTKAQWMALLAAFLGWMFDGLEMGLFPIIARPALTDLMGLTDANWAVHRGITVAAFGLGWTSSGLDPGFQAGFARPALESFLTVNQKQWSDMLIGLWNGRIVACFLFGAAFGGLLFGWLGDRIGRIRSMIFSILTYSLFTGCCYFATAPWHLGFFRFLSALGMGGEWSLGVALVMECWPERHRPILAGAIGAASNVGFLLIALLGMCFHVTADSWRWMTLAGAAPALLTLFIRLTVPESERWKAAVRQKKSKPVREIFASGMRKTTLLAIVFASVPLIGTWAAISGWLPVWADQLTGGKLPHAKALTQVSISIGAIIGCLIAPLIGGRIGRRPAYFGLSLLSLLVCAFLFRAFDTFGVFFVLTTGVAGMVTAAFYGWLPLYLPELFPTRVRATGQGLSFNFGRILAGFAALYMGQLVHFLGGSYARAGATVTLIYVLGLFLIWLAPETKGKPLPE